MIQPLTRQMEITDNIGCLFSAVFLETKDQIYFGNDSSGGVRCFSYKSETTKMICSTDFSVYAMEKTPDEAIVLVSGNDHNILVIDTFSQKLSRKIINPAAAINGIQVTNDGHFFVVDSSKHIRKYSLETFEERLRVKAFSPSEKCCLILSRNNQHIYGTSFDNTACSILVLRQNKFKQYFLSKINSIRCHRLSTDEKYIFSGSGNGVLGISNTLHRKKLKIEHLENGDITCIQVNPNYVFISCFSKVLFVLSAKFPFWQVQKLEYPTFVFHIALNSKHGKLLVGGFKQKCIQIFRINKGIK